jgi:hypothetical protein
MRTVLVFISLLLLVECSERRKASTNNLPKEPADFSESFFTNLTPMVDGSLYAKDFDGRLWYVNNAVAVQVKASAGELPDFPEIIPNADGSAYANSYGVGLWQLVGAKAIRVTESSQASGSVRQIPAGKGLYAIYLYERRRRIAAEDKAAEVESGTEDRDSGYDEDY